MNLKNGQIITIKPLNKRMKDRVHQHGDIFLVKQIGKSTIQSEEYDTLLESLEKTFSVGSGKKEKWLGWTLNKRDFIVLKIKEA